jgi:hypothetical protein
MNRFIEFFPNPDLSLSEKLNALVRLSFYISLLLMIFFGNYLYIYIFIVILVFTYLIYKNYTPKKIEDFQDYKSLINSEYNDITHLDKIEQLVLENNSEIETSLNDYGLTSKKKTNPTINNPFMNINQITDNRKKSAGDKYYDKPEVAAKVEKGFEFNLYRDVSDLYNKRNSQRQYYTMPSTTIPNEQTSFAKWLYLSPPTCKEDSIRCVPESGIPPPNGNGGLEYIVDL